MSKTGKNYRVGLVTGTFDLLHAGHLNLWQQAAARCEQLIIGLESDARVRARKGQTRPLLPQNYRKKRILQVFPDAQVIILPDNFGEENVRLAFLREYHVDALFVGADDPFLENKKKLMKQVSGDLVNVKNEPLISMTQILRGEQSADYLLLPEDRAWLK